jgi:putative alpha-1,2-mannosidase
VCRHNDSHIRAFSHTHLVGAGVGDFGNIGIMAVTKPLSSREIHPRHGRGYMSRFSHETEVATPGYYAVTLEDPGVRVELTSPGTHVGFHRYTFPPSTLLKVTDQP